jgi:hypothetical protein
MSFIILSRLTLLILVISAAVLLSVVIAVALILMRRGRGTARRGFDVSHRSMPPPPAERKG